MRLEGSLDAFSLPDIFQLLSFTRKTGGLHLAHHGLRDAEALPLENALGLADQMPGLRA